MILGKVMERSGILSVYSFALSWYLSIFAKILFSIASNAEPESWYNGTEETSFTDEVSSVSGLY